MGSLTWDIGKDKEECVRYLLENAENRFSYIFYFYATIYCKNW